MHCDEVKLDLCAYGDGELDAARREALAQHLAGCPACAIEAERSARLSRILQSHPVPPAPPGLADRVLDRWRDHSRPATALPGGTMNQNSPCPNCQFPLGANSAKCDYCRMFDLGARAGSRRNPVRWWAALTLVAIAAVWTGLRVPRTGAPPVSDATSTATPPAASRLPADLARIRFPALDMAYTHENGMETEAVLRDFSLQGPLPGPGVRIADPIDQVVQDQGTGNWYGFSAVEHRIGMLKPAPGSGAEVRFANTLSIPHGLTVKHADGSVTAERDTPFLWPAGLAFDSKRKVLLVATVARGSRLYAWKPDAAGNDRWSALMELGDLIVNGMVYAARDDAVYVVGAYAGDATSLYRIDLARLRHERVCTLDSLSLPDRLEQVVQLQPVGDHLVMIYHAVSISDDARLKWAEPRIAVVSLRKARVIHSARTTPRAGTGRVAQAWSLPADTELHVIGWDDTTVPVPVVPKERTVRIRPTDKPLVVLLGSLVPVTWKLEVPPGVPLVQVIYAGSRQQRVEGAPPERIFDLTAPETDPAQPPGSQAPPNFFRAAERCVSSGDYFPPYFDQLPRQISSLTKLAVSSYQGGSFSGDYELNATAEPIPPPPASSRLHVFAVRGDRAVLGLGRRRGSHAQVPVRIEILRRGEPLVLVLSGEAPIRWEFALAEGVHVERVILAGYSYQETRGLPPETRVIHRSCNRHDGRWFQLSIPRSVSSDDLNTLKVEDLVNIRECANLKPVGVQRAGTAVAFGIH